MWEPRPPEAIRADFAHNSYRKVLFQKLLYYKMDTGVVGEEVIQQEHFVSAVHVRMPHNAYKTRPLALLLHYTVSRTESPIEEALPDAPQLHNEGKIFYQ